MILGRRGPAQAAFTNPELRELGELARADVVVDPAELELDPASAAGSSRGRAPTARRNVEHAARVRAARARRASRTAIELRFLRSPVEILGEGDDGPVTGVRVVAQPARAGRAAACARCRPASEEVIACGLVIRSIGYRGRPLPGVPFDERRGLIRNEGGRVCDEDGTPRARRVRRRLDQARAVRRHRHEQEGRRRHRRADCSRTRDARPAQRRRRRRAATRSKPGCATRVPGLVTWEGWQAIDEHERGLGEPQGRPRVKLVRVPDMLAVAGQKTGLSV